MATAKTGDQLASFFKKAATGIEKLQVQLALGEAEAADKYEELKKKFSRFVKAKKAEIGTNARSAAKDIQAELEMLQVQLVLGKAETKEAFEEQRKKIMKAMAKLEVKINQADKLGAAIGDEILHELETMRIKLEMLEVYYSIGKMDAKDEFEKRKHDLNAMVAKAKAKIASKKDEFRATRLRRHAELKESYKHLRKAFMNA